MPFPAPILAVLTHFQPLFTAPTWRKMMTLLTGTLLAHGSRTVTAALRHSGNEMESHFSSFHQVLNRACWSSLTVSRLLLQLLVSTFVQAQAGGCVEIVIDETLERLSPSLFSMAFTADEYIIGTCVHFSQFNTHNYKLTN